VDYLTQYSGIKPGDLDPLASPHHLTTLKSAYIKLRYLLDNGLLRVCPCSFFLLDLFFITPILLLSSSGVKFVGHNLKKDFQMINMYIDPSQVIDTSELFCLQNNRKLSLKFLAAHLLKSSIQGDTHDSIEDARTALALYHRYLELQKEGTLHSTIQALYNEGLKTGFKVQASSSSSSISSSSTSTSLLSSNTV
jgi:PAB-dependent poly(A)-specific ribonuclease subunit 2